MIPLAINVSTQKPIISFAFRPAMARAGKAQKGCIKFVQASPHATAIAILGMETSNAIAASNITGAKEFANIKKLVGTDHNDEHVQTVVAAIWDILYDLYPNIEEIILRITEVNDDIDRHLAEAPVLFPSPFTVEEEEWLAQAISIYLEKKGMGKIEDKKEND